MYSSDEDEVPVVYLTDEGTNAFEAPVGIPGSHKLASSTSPKRKTSRRKKATEKDRESRHHRHRRGRKRTPSPPLQRRSSVASAYAEAAAASRQHHHNHVGSGGYSQQQKIETPSVQDIPQAFRIGGSIVEKAKSIFTPPAPAALSRQNSTASSRQTPVDNGLSYRHRANNSWQSFQPTNTNKNISNNNINNLGMMHSNKSTPILSFEQSNFLNEGGGGFGDVLPDASGEDKVLEKERLQQHDGKDEAPKSLITTLREIHPAVYFSTVLAGLLVVRQRDDIEQYLHEGIGVLFSTINALTILVTAVGATLFCVNFVLKRSKNLGFGLGANANKGIKGAGDKRQEYEGDENEPMLNHQKTLDEMMDSHHFVSNDDLRNNSFGGAGGPGGFAGGGGISFGLPFGGGGSGAAPLQPAPQMMDEFYDGPTPLGVQQNHPRQQSRSYSIPTILNPKPVRPTSIHQQQPSYPNPFLGGAKRSSPTSAPVIDPNNFSKPHNSYFPYFDSIGKNSSGLGLGIGGGSGGGDMFIGGGSGAAAPRAAPNHNRGKNKTPPNYGKWGDKFAPISMPQVPAGMGSGYYMYDSDENKSDDENSEVKSFDIEMDKREKKESKGFVNPKKLVFRRREQTPVIQEEGDDDDTSLIGINDAENHTYVDDFSCKPWGPPPKRYHGVNV